MQTTISPASIAASLTEFWSPRIVGELEESYIKVAKVKGAFEWHCHDEEDELFYVLKGHLRIELEDSVVELAEGEMYIVPKGVQHHPVAEDECHILLIERKSTLHTGDLVTEKTVAIENQR